LVFSPEVAAEDTSVILERINQFILQKGGGVSEVNHWGRRRLAYPIKKFVEGDYVLAQIQLEPRWASELEANLRLSDGILRYLLVKRGLRYPGKPSGNLDRRSEEDGVLK
jgi:small subunit ribosomal protein S6